MDLMCYHYIHTVYYSFSDISKIVKNFSPSGSKILCPLHTTEERRGLYLLTCFEQLKKNIKV